MLSEGLFCYFDFTKSTKINFFYIFIEKNFVMSEICYTFAAELKKKRKKKQCKCSFRYISAYNIYRKQTTRSLTTKTKQI